MFADGQANGSSFLTDNLKRRTGRKVVALQLIHTCGLFEFSGPRTEHPCLSPFQIVNTLSIAFIILRRPRLLFVSYVAESFDVLIIDTCSGLFPPVGSSGTPALEQHVRADDAPGGVNAPIPCDHSFPDDEHLFGGLVEPDDRLLGGECFALHVQRYLQNRIR